jgi:hypothetical protein
MEPSSCVVSGPVGWEQQLNDNTVVFNDNGERVVGENVIYVRVAGSKDAPAELRLAFKQAVSLAGLAITCNARFAEVYTQNDALLKYHSTIRGTNTDEQNVFASTMQEELECREVVLKFLSIKPAVDTGIATAVDLHQLRLQNFHLQYRRVKRDITTSSNTSQSSNASAMNMMSMMALSMMAAPGGGLGPVSRAVSSPSRGANTGLQEGGGAGAGGMAALLGMAVSAMQQPGRAGNSLCPAGVPAGTAYRDSGGPSNAMHGVHVWSVEPAAHRIKGTIAVDDPDAQISISNRDDSEFSHGVGHTGGECVAQTVDLGTAAPVRRAETPAAAKAKAAAAPKAAAGSAPALDVSQLASILWTVKSSIVSEIDTLLERRLAPVIAKLDALEGQVQELRRQQHSSGNSEIGQPPVTSGAVREGDNRERCDSMLNSEHTVD